MYMYIYTYTYAHTYIHTHIYIYPYVYLYVFSDTLHLEPTRSEQHGVEAGARHGILSRGRVGRWMHAGFD